MILQILKSQVNYCHSLKAAKRLYLISISHNFVKQNMASAWVVHYGKSNHNQFNFVYQKKSPNNRFSTLQNVPFLPI